MNKTLFLGLTLAVSLSAFAQAPQATQNSSGLPANEPPMAGMQWIRGFDPNVSDRPGQAKGQVKMLYHGGPIMSTAVSESIFWGPSWTSSTFVGDKITGLESFYIGFSDSNYSKTCDEYTATSHAVVGATTSHLVACNR